MGMSFISHNQVVNFLRLVSINLGKHTPCNTTGHTHIVKNRYRIRNFVGFLVGGKKTIQLTSQL